MCRDSVRFCRLNLFYKSLPSGHAFLPHEPAGRVRIVVDEDMNILRWRYLNGFLLSVTLFVGRSSFLLAQSGASTPVFSKDIAPILYQHCASCHRTGQIAPKSLLSYDEVRPWA